MIVKATDEKINVATKLQLYISEYVYYNSVIAKIKSHVSNGEELIL